MPLLCRIMEGYEIYDLRREFEKTLYNYQQMNFKESMRFQKKILSWYNRMGRENSITFSLMNYIFIQAVERNMCPASFIQSIFEESKDSETNQTKFPDADEVMRRFRKQCSR